MQAFLHDLRAANVSDPNIEDLYKEAQGESLVYNSKDNPEMQEKMEMVRDKLVLTRQRKAVLKSAEEDKDSDNELKLDNEFSADNKSNQASSAHSHRLKKVQSPVDKIYSSKFSHEHFTDMSHVLAVYHCCRGLLLGEETLDLSCVDPKICQARILSPHACLKHVYMMEHNLLQDRAWNLAYRGAYLYYSYAISQ